MTPEIQAIQARTGVTFTAPQVEAGVGAAAMEPASARACLYFKTGAGKTAAALLQMAVWGQDDVLVIAPPATADSWEAWAKTMGISIQVVSHAKYRMADFKVARDQAVIADEFHLFGGHRGKGWKKFDTMARHLRAPIVIASATPNYNDVERVYCIQHVLDPASCRGGYLAFIYAHCETEQNPFGMEPLVKGFRVYKDAADYLSQLPGVFYVEDDLVYTIEDRPIIDITSRLFNDYGYDARRHRIMASGMEERHRRIDRNLIDMTGRLVADYYVQITDLIEHGDTPILVYADHATVARALAVRLEEDNFSYAVIDGKTSKKEKMAKIEAFRQRKFDVLVGTATLATGTDGLDRVCDTLVILDDTDDDSLRRQLIGRIMPRGGVGDASTKRVIRFKRA